MELQIEMVPGEVLEIPPRLSLSLQAAEGLEVVELDGEKAYERANSLLLLAEQYDNPHSAAMAALQAAALFTRQQEAEQIVLCLGIYAGKRADSLAALGRHAEALGLLTDLLDLANRALARCRPKATRKLTELAARTIEAAFALCAQPAFADILTTTDDIASILDIAPTIWGPDLEAELGELARTMPALADIVAGGPDLRAHGTSAERALQDLAALRDRLARKKAYRGKLQERLHLIEGAITTMIQAVQREAIREANTQPRHAHEIDLETLAFQTQKLIGEVERRLRGLIAGKYAQQFGTGWVHHIESKHKMMYDYWTRNIERDRSNFRAYDHYSPDILEYARFEDLSELIMAQWQLFRAILDFGYGDKNRSVFHDKMAQIAHVRNPLAHHRSIPENELLRAKVLCTDILLALDRTDEAIGP